jgi:hypothetical protein
MILISMPLERAIFSSTIGRFPRGGADNLPSAIGGIRRKP